MILHFLMFTNRFDRYKRQQKQMQVKQKEDNRTAWFSAVARTRKEMLAIDRSIIAGLRSENGLIKEELQQLK